MILPWMLYASMTALLLGLAARCLEGVVRQRGQPIRGLWAGALLGSVCLPTFAAFVIPGGKSTAPTAALSDPQRL